VAYSVYTLLALLAVKKEGRSRSPEFELSKLVVRQEVVPPVKRGLSQRAMLALLGTHKRCTG
jgi:hypothetical protein